MRVPTVRKVLRAWVGIELDAESSTTVRGNSLESLDEVRLLLISAARMQLREGHEPCACSSAIVRDEASTQGMNERT
jgi:hypothetical protein